jgi:3-ketosteroid 9alpha-monooxygenase subunit B
VESEGELADGTAASAAVRSGRGAVTTITAEQEVGRKRSHANTFHTIRVKEVVPETSDAVSLVFDVSADLGELHYQAGQFLTVRVVVGGAEHLRCYSMSSAPGVDDDLRITIKRDPGGLVSNWLNDHAKAGDEVEVSAPAGAFVLRPAHRDIVAFAGGSGITPVFSLVRTALACSGRRVRLFYANRDRNSIIFIDVLRELAERYGDRLTVAHHLDNERGIVHAKEISAFCTGVDDADYYICGPGAFMDTVKETLLGRRIDPDRLHLERFQVTEVAVGDLSRESTTTREVSIRLDRRTTVVAYREGNTLLQTARIAGLRAPSSCETGICGTCMARVIEGSARMLNNDALADDEVAEGWVLTCQSLPTSPTIEIAYE